MKNYKKILDLLGQDTISEMDSAETQQLHKIIVDAESAMKEAQDELDANEEYQRIKEQLGAITAGKKEVNKRQRAKIAYALELLGSKSLESK